MEQNDFMNWWKAFNAARADFGMAEADFSEARHWFWADEDNEVRREHAKGQVFSAFEAAQAAFWGAKS
jgi:hypothetical protein